MTARSVNQKEHLYKRGLFLEYFTIVWNINEAVVAVAAGIVAGSTALIAFGWWWADSAGALAMLPVIIWQGWETLDKARRSRGEGG